MKSRAKISYSLSVALVLSLVIVPTRTAIAEECKAEKCIEVTVDDESDEIVVTYRSSSPGKSKKGPGGERRESTNSGSFSAAGDPKRTWIPYHPDRYAAWREAARKAAATRKRNREKVAPPAELVVASTSLSDRVSQMIPIGDIQFQPVSGATLHTPVFFWTTTPTKFEVTLKVAGIPVGVSLKPEFLWEYGEGTTRQTSLPGAPYPLALNTFTYHHAGVKKIKLTTTWNGTFTVAGLSSPIDGVITQKRERDLTIYKAPTRLLG